MEKNIDVSIIMGSDSDLPIMSEAAKFLETMNISYEGIGELVVTFPIGSGEVGKVCKVGQTGAADKCGIGDAFCGVLLSKESGRAAVQVEGFARVGYSGSKPAHGYVKLAADGKVTVESHSHVTAGNNPYVVNVLNYQLKPLPGIIITFLL